MLVSSPNNLARATAVGSLSAVRYPLFLNTRRELCVAIPRFLVSTNFSFSRSCRLFHSPYPVTPLFATLTHSAGVYTNNSHSETRHPSLITRHFFPCEAGQSLFPFAVICTKTQNPLLCFQWFAHSSAIRWGWGVEAPPGTSAIDGGRNDGFRRWLGRFPPPCHIDRQQHAREQQKRGQKVRRTGKMQPHARCYG